MRTHLSGLFFVQHQNNYTAGSQRSPILWTLIVTYTLLQKSKLCYKSDSSTSSICTKRYFYFKITNYTQHINSSQINRQTRNIICLSTGTGTPRATNTTAGLSVVSKPKVGRLQTQNCLTGSESGLKSGKSRGAGIEKAHCNVSKRRYNATMAITLYCISGSTASYTLEEEWTFISHNSIFKM